MSRPSLIGIPDRDFANIVALSKAIHTPGRKDLMDVSTLGFTVRTNSTNFRGK